MTGKLLAIFDRAVADLNDKPRIWPELEEVFKTLTDDVLTLGKNEVPTDVRDFFQSWYAKHWDLKHSLEGAPTGELPHNEEVKEHVERHHRDIVLTSSLYDWVMENAAKSIPPTIIYFALMMYAGTISGFYRCMADKLYGAELPDSGDEQDEPEEENE